MLRRMDLSRTFVDKDINRDRSSRAKESLQILLSLNHDYSLGRLLDLGSGKGQLSLYYSNVGIETVGVDILPLCGASRQFALVQASGTNLPFVDDTFYTVILIDVLEHVNYVDSNKLMKAVKRVLRENGRLYISVANRYAPFEPHAHLPFLTWMPRATWRALNITDYPYSKKDLRALCERSGFLWKDFTSVYVSKKLNDVNNIGNKLQRNIIRLLKKSKLLIVMRRILDEISIIVFVCGKREEE